MSKILIATAWVGIFAALLMAPTCYTQSTKGLPCYKLTLKPEIDIYTRLNDPTAELLKTTAFKVVLAPQRKCD